MNRCFARLGLSDCGFVALTTLRINFLGSNPAASELHLQPVQHKPPKQQKTACSGRNDPKFAKITLLGPFSAVCQANGCPISARSQQPHPDEQSSSNQSHRQPGLFFVGSHYFRIVAFWALVRLSPFDVTLAMEKRTNEQAPMTKDKPISMGHWGRRTAKSSFLTKNQKMIHDDTTNTT